MTPDDYQRLRGLFDRAMERPAADRPGFIDSQVAADDPLRADLLKWLAAGDDSAFLAHGNLTGMPTSMAGVAPDSQLQIDHYKIVRELGRGGMGVVYLALRNDDVFHKLVALKVIGADGARNADFVQRFKQERQILAGLDHPNIARILDGGSTEDGRPFYVMEYIAGSSIDDYCRRTAADVPTRVRLIAEVCRAVEYLHGHAIAHRDIKPNNILVTADGQPKLMDFGIAKVDTVEGLVASPSSPGQPTMIMTPGYASPEQISGAPSGKSGDVYSLGVVLYQLLTGTLPYSDADGRPNLAEQLSGKDPTAPSRAANVQPATGRRDSKPVHSQDLDRVVLTALQRDPVRRYATIQLFAEDLRRYLEGRPIAARKETWTYTFGLFARRNKVAVSLAALLAVAAVIGGGTTIRAALDRARLEAKTEEVERLVALLNTHVDRWQQTSDPVSPAEKAADVNTAGQVMTSGTLTTIAERTPDPPRVKRVVTDLHRFLDRADRLSNELPALRKDIAVVYRQVGDFESTAPRPQIADRERAVESYKRSASIAAAVGARDPAWMEATIAQLSARLKALGVEVELAAASAPTAPSMAAAPVPAVEAPASPRIPILRPAAPTEVRDATAAPVERGPIDERAYAELVDRLRTTAGAAQRARTNLEALRARLAAQGQTIRPDLLSTLAQVDAMVEEARTRLTANDLESANEELTKANYQLRRLAQSGAS